MRLAIELSRANVAHGTGGPFGAALFRRDSGELVSAGVNLVVPQHCSSAHAEIVALSLAQASLRTHTLAAPGLPPLQLVSSTEPCAMCMGAVCWSGVVELVCGAEDADARSVGFDEGPKASHWERALEERGIEVITGVLRAEAADVLTGYAKQGGLIYNR